MECSLLLSLCLVVENFGEGRTQGLNVTLSGGFCWIVPSNTTSIKGLLTKPNDALQNSQENDHNDQYRHNGRVPDLHHKVFQIMLPKVGEFPGNFANGMGKGVRHDLQWTGLGWTGLEGLLLVRH